MRMYIGRVLLSAGVVKTHRMMLSHSELALITFKLRLLNICAHHLASLKHLLFEVSFTDLKKMPIAMSSANHPIGHIYVYFKSFKSFHPVICLFICSSQFCFILI